MKITYDYILNEMKRTFSKSTKEPVESYNDIGIRFQAVASEIYSLCCMNEHSLKQAFPQTATGKYLDYLAELRDITRKRASKATGKLTFYREEGRTGIIRISVGAVCAMADNPYIQFKTAGPCIINTAAKSATVSAVALNYGEEYNVDANCVDVLVTCPEGVGAVTNPVPFVNGCSEESDESLRKRIIGAYSVVPTGVSINHLEQIILNNPEVVDCKIHFNTDKNFDVYIKSRNGIDSDIVATVNDALVIADFFGASVNVYDYSDKPVNIVAQVNSNKKDISDSLAKRIRELCSDLRIGENLDLRKTGFALADFDGVEYCELICESALDGIVRCNVNECISIGNIEVLLYE